MKLQRLADGVLAEARVEHQHFLMRRGGIQAPGNPHHFGELLHQPRLVLQAAGGVREHDIDAARLRGLQRVEDDGRRVCAGLLGDHRHVVARAPGLQLLDGGGPVSVAGSEQHLQAFRLVAPRELADRRGLAGAVHADHEDEERSPAAGNDERAGSRPQDLGQGLLQGRPSAGGVGNGLAPQAPAEPFDDSFRGLDADVGEQQLLLEFGDDGVVELAADQPIDRDPEAEAAVEFFPEALKKPGARCAPGGGLFDHGWHSATTWAHEERSDKK